MRTESSGGLGREALLDRTTGGRLGGFLRCAAIAFVVIATAACSSGGRAQPSPTASSVSDDTLTRLGDFERVDANEATIGAEAALDGARKQEFGRPGQPEVVLVRSRGSELDLVPTAKGSLLWVYHWGQLGEADVEALPGPDGEPQETVFVREDYFLLVDATTGEVVMSVRQ